MVFDIDENYVDQEAKQALDEQNGGAAGGQASFSKADYSQYFKELDYTNDKVVLVRIRAYVILASSRDEVVVSCKA